MSEPRIRQTPFPATASLYQGKKPVVLLVLDGWGITPEIKGNAIALAKTPHMDQLWEEYPHTLLGASGEHVGLPAGVDGNSETGHTNIGAGRIVWQSLSQIDRAIADGSFFENQVLLDAIEHARKNNSKLHCVGLVGSGFVHSSTQHLLALLKLAKDQGVSQLAVHAFTDGRDAPPTASLSSLQQVEQELQQLGVGRLASITGRFYGMDRDRNWDRTQKAYELLTLGRGQQATDWQAALQQSYDSAVTDEFVEPIVILDRTGNPTVIQDNDAVIFFNFRVDRPRQLTWAFVLPDFEQRDLTGSSSGQELTTEERAALSIKNFSRGKVLQNLFFATMSDYDSDLKNPKAFARENIDGNLGQALSEAGVRQLRLTETEKEKMVTYYMDGKREQPYPGEHWVILPSKKTRSYADIPEMTAVEITDELVRQIQEGVFDAAIVNLPNGDMVGHTGDLQAGIRACEIVDQQVGRIAEAMLQTEGILIITADHGNVEEMIDLKTGGIDTKHSIFPVPLILVGKEFAGRPDTLPVGVLGDVAPTMLQLMSITQPPEMTGKALIQS